MKKDVAEYISKYLEWQQVKVEYMHIARLVQPIQIPEEKWEVVSMEFMMRLPKIAKQHDVIMVVVDKLSKASHFIIVNSTHKSIDLAQILMKEIFRLYGVPKKIISN